MSPNRLSWRYVSASAVCARAPSSMMRGWVAIRVTATPAAAPRRIREVLRMIIRLLLESADTPGAFFFSPRAASLVAAIFTPDQAAQDDRAVAKLVVETP